MGKVKFIPPPRPSIQLKGKETLADNKIVGKHLLHKKSTKQMTEGPHPDVYKFISTSPKKVVNSPHQKRLQKKKRKAKVMERVLKDIFRMKKDIASLRQKGKRTTPEP